MKVPFVNYPQAFNTPRIRSAIRVCLAAGDLIYRDDLIQFEREFAHYHGCEYGIGTGSCTGAMFLALKLIGASDAGYTYTVSHTYIATLDAVVAAGGEFHLLDVNPKTMVQDSENDIPLWSDPIFLPVHLNGYRVDVGALKKKFPRAFIIEDAAQAIGHDYSASDIVCFSFYPAKILGGIGEGGMAITNNKALAKELYLLRDHGEYPHYISPDSKGTIYKWGYNSILDNIHAAVLKERLKDLPNILIRRSEIAGKYTEALKQYHSFMTLPPDDQAVFQNYVIRLRDRDILQQWLEEAGIETMIHWKTPNHKQLWLNIDNYKLPNTEKISETCLSLPLYPEMTDEQVKYVIERIHQLFE